MKRKEPKKEPLTEREVKQLIKLLDKFSEVPPIPNKLHLRLQATVVTSVTGNPVDYLTLGERQIIYCVRQLVKWYAEDSEMDLDLA